MKKQQISSIIFDKWQSFVFGLIGLGGLLALFLYNFQTIAPKIAPGELNVLNKGLHDILSRPEFIHHQVIQKLISATGSNDLLAIRLPSVIVATLSIVALYFIIKNWYSKRVAFIGSALFASSSWVLHVARLGSVDVNYLLLSVPVLALVLLKANRYSLTGAVLLLLSGVVLLYLPGLIWLVIPTFIWQRRLLIQIFRNISPLAIGLIALGFVFGLLPLIVATSQDPKFIMHLAALPDSIEALLSIPGHFVSGIIEIFFSREYSPMLGIASVPYLSVAISVLVVLGVVNAYNHRKLERAKAITILTIAGLLLHGLSQGAISLVFVLPFLYLYAVDGTIYLYRKWLSIFPKNPLAEKVAILSILAVMVCISAYELTRYFVAWPHTDGHASVFQLTDEQ